MKNQVLKKSLFTFMVFIMIVGGIFQAPAVNAQPLPDWAEGVPAPGPAFIPPGFVRVITTTGVNVYENADYRTGHRAYVMEVSLKRGASLRLVNGNVMGAGSVPGSYGGPNPTFERIALLTGWKRLAASTPGAVCITNGQFFSPTINPTELAFPMKAPGVLTEGYDAANAAYTDGLEMLELWGDHADIVPLSLSGTEFLGSTAPTILAGLPETFPKGSPDDGRTFLGVKDSDADGTYDRVLIFNSDFARQVEDAAQVLQDFGADKVMMLDGGGSTQLRCGARSYLAGDGRALPQMLAIVQAPYEFNSQFNGSAVGWSRVTGKWAASASAYWTPGVAGYFSSTKHTGLFTRLNFSARLKRTGCVSCSNTLMIRGAPLPLISLNAWYKGYYFQYTNNGYFSVFKLNRGYITALQPWTYSSAIHTGNWNVLRVTGAGSVLRFYINNMLVWSGKDGALPSGVVGLGMYRPTYTTGDRLYVDWSTLSTIIPASSASSVPVSGPEVSGGDLFHSP